MGVKGTTLLRVRVTGSSGNQWYPFLRYGEVKFPIDLINETLVRVYLKCSRGNKVEYSQKKCLRTFIRSLFILWIW